jgi:cytochrome c oxidase assembly protein subunit 15
VSELPLTTPYDDPSKRAHFVWFTWAAVALNVVVILWGAWVRATGSGAGCGSHWPLCNGAVVPPSPEAATVIEFVHRATSGLALVAVLALLLAAWRVYPRGHFVRWTMSAAGGFILLEAAIGAGLVIFGLVAGDTSIVRAAVGALHLANTYLLLAALTLSAVMGREAVSPSWRGGRGEVALVGISLGFLLLVGMTGAVTALGDTVFRPESLAAGITQELASAAHPLVRMRLIHPGVALLASLLTAYCALTLSGRDTRSTAGRGAPLIWALLVVQLFAGAINVLLLAPLGLQVIHLLLSDLIWILVIALSARALSVPG